MISGAFNLNRRAYSEVEIMKNGEVSLKATAR